MTRIRTLVLAFGILAVACAEPARDLTELIVVDSLYQDPVTHMVWTGPVFRSFDDEPAGLQLEGALLDGAWDGELTVYHPNGRLRYMGSFSRGSRCGPWTENADSVATQSVYDALIREVETMGLYPPCTESR